MAGVAPVLLDQVRQHPSCGEALTMDLAEAQQVEVVQREVRTGALDAGPPQREQRRGVVVGTLGLSLLQLLTSRSLIGKRTVAW